MWHACMCAFIHTCMYAIIYAWTAWVYTSIFMHVLECTHVCLYLCMNSCVYNVFHVRICPGLCEFISSTKQDTSLHTNMCMYMCSYSAHVHKCITHTRTHTHTHSPTHRRAQTDSPKAVHEAILSMHANALCIWIGWQERQPNQFLSQKNASGKVHINPNVNEREISSALLLSRPTQMQAAVKQINQSSTQSPCTRCDYLHMHRRWLSSHHDWKTQVKHIRQSLRQAELQSRVHRGTNC